MSKKITELSGSSTPLDGTEQVPVVQSSATTQTTVNHLLAAERRYFKAHRNGVNQGSIAVDGTKTKLLFTHTEIDPLGEFDTVNSRYVPQTAGTYWLYTQLVYNSDHMLDKQPLRIYMYKNSNVVSYAHAYAPANGRGDFLSFSVIVTADGSTDYFEVFAWPDGIHPNYKVVHGGAHITYFCGHYLGAAT